MCRKQKGDRKRKENVAFKKGRKHEQKLLSQIDHKRSRIIPQRTRFFLSFFKLFTNLKDCPAKRGKMLCRMVVVTGRKKKAGSVPVYLNVYDLTPINGYAYWLGLGVYHSGVEGL